MNELRLSAADLTLQLFLPCARARTGAGEGHLEKITRLAFWIENFCARVFEKTVNMMCVDELDKKNKDSIEWWKQKRTSILYSAFHREELNKETDGVCESV